MASFEENQNCENSYLLDSGKKSGQKLPEMYIRSGELTYEYEEPPTGETVAEGMPYSLTSPSSDTKSAANVSIKDLSQNLQTKPEEFEAFIKHVSEEAYLSYNSLYENKSSDISEKAKSATGIPNTIYKCMHCGDGLNSVKELTEHKKIHSDETYTCGLCGLDFQNAKTLTDHMMSHTGEKPHKCQLCKAVFKMKKELVRHQLVHKNDRPHKCELCSAAFNHKWNLKSHMRTHTGERPYKCTICTATFAQRSDLTIHTRSHTGEKPFSCNICGGKFIQSGDLNRHMRRHTGEKPYVCGYCGYGFRQKSDLTCHTRIHTGEKPYKCPHCGLAFTLKTYLNKHIERHVESIMPAVTDGAGNKSMAEVSTLVGGPSDISMAKIQIFRCQHCGCVYSRQRDLNRHIQLMHTESLAAT